MCRCSTRGWGRWGGAIHPCKMTLFSPAAWMVLLRGPRSGPRLRRETGERRGSFRAGPPGSSPVLPARTHRPVASTGRSFPRSRESKPACALPRIGDPIGALEHFLASVRCSSRANGPLGYLPWSPTSRASRPGSPLYPWRVSGEPRPVASYGCWRMRLIRSCTRLYSSRSSRMRSVTRRTAYSTVVWSRQKPSPMRGSD
jgi:hypothetical protein